jgi:hypothetical protein
VDPQIGERVAQLADQIFGDRGVGPERCAHGHANGRAGDHRAHGERGLVDRRDRVSSVGRVLGADDHQPVLAERAEQLGGRLERRAQQDDDIALEVPHHR